MCELLGMSANVPTDICFSFTGLMQRGGKTGPHGDGWGIGFYEGKGYRAFHDYNPSASSQVAGLISQHPIKSQIVLCHIRQANVGKVCLENTHPFSREMWGRRWAFAHNGQLKGIKKWPLKHYLPIGTTDSEHAFCWMLDQIRKKFPSAPQKPRHLWETIEKLLKKIDGLGVFNILMSDDKYLYAYCSTKLSWITRRAPFGEACLKDKEVLIDFAKETTPNDIVTVIATEPLTDNEEWQVMEKARFHVFHRGLEQYGP